MQDERARETLGCAIAVMAKASIPGLTKTRLIPPLTPEQAADLNTAFLRDVADNLLAAAILANISAWMAYAPAGSQDFFARNMPDGVSLLETVAPDISQLDARIPGALRPDQEVRTDSRVALAWQPALVPGNTATLEYPT